MEETQQLLKVDGLKDENQWFAELGTLWKGQAFCLKYNKVLFHQRSKFQDVLILDTETYGRVLVLDGVIQVTQRDQFSYAEMITHLPMFAHPDPEHVVLIGGGDGAVLTEIVKHRSVKTVTICEIDEMVIEVSKKFFPEYAAVWTHPKLTVHIGDGAAFLDSHKKKFDIVIVDSSDPVGPAEALFEQAFFRSCKRALKKDGVLCTQGECQWLHVDIIAQVTKSCQKLFKQVQYGFTTIPTYPSGQIGFIVCRKGRETVKKPQNKVRKALTKKTRDSLKYYTEEIHRAAFAIPKFTLDKIHVSK